VPSFFYIIWIVRVSSSNSPMTRLAENRKSFNKETAIVPLWILLATAPMKTMVQLPKRCVT
jgi:hypothetical protein